MSVVLWNEADGYLSELDTFACGFVERFPKASVRPISMAGGTPGMQATLPITEYAQVLGYLLVEFGDPQIKEPWHPDHTRGVQVLTFPKTRTLEPGKMWHVNLIAMMQRKDKRYALVAWM